MTARFASLLFPIALACALSPAVAGAQGSFIENVDAAGEPSPAAVREWLQGRSGSLRVAVVKRADAIGEVARAMIVDPDTRYRWVPVHASDGPLLGEPAFSVNPGVPASSGIWRLESERPTEEPTVAVITEVPISEKRQGRLNGYHIGTYPTEGSGRTDAYATPSGFIEVTRESQELLVSEHFRLRNFLTKDQAEVWPKYVALRLELIDKLELVLQELQRMGIRAEGMYVMSGYRTPQYNGPGGDGRAQLSRHMYGDAADVWVDSDGDGYIDDLNGDGRRDTRDVDVMMRAVERVERKHPELVGGAGIYGANEAHGPFIHIDVRGSRSRW